MYDGTAKGLITTEQSLRNSIAKQFRDPEGPSGHVIGQIMSIINRLPNRHAIEMLDVAERDNILEIGFGPGRALKALSKLAHRGTVTGIDQSDVMFQQARTHNRRAIKAGKVKLVRGSFEAIPLPDASVDKILAVNVIYFFSPTGNALAEARRVLRPGGTMSIYATDYSSKRKLQFVGSETHQMFDKASLGVFLKNGAFTGDLIDLHKVRLPFGFNGLLARLCKSS